MQAIVSLCRWVFGGLSWKSGGAEGLWIVLCVFRGLSWKRGGADGLWILLCVTMIAFPLSGKTYNRMSLTDLAGATTHEVKNLAMLDIDDRSPILITRIVSE
jgi:hypothetical protein